jgi:hypothetical protein
MGVEVSGMTRDAIDFELDPISAGGTILSGFGTVVLPSKFRISENGSGESATVANTSNDELSDTRLGASIPLTLACRLSSNVLGVRTGPLRPKLAAVIGADRFPDRGSGIE